MKLKYKKFNKKRFWQKWEKKCWLNLPKISLGYGSQLYLSQQNLKQNHAGLILELYVGLDCFGSEPEEYISWEQTMMGGARMKFDPRERRFREDLFG